MDVTTKIKKVTGQQNDLSNFLKRKRLEMGLKLEELSSGICSTSYLSRIENNLVEVDQTYYKALFEKLNINYENVKNDRSRNLYQELLMKYLKKEEQGLEMLLQQVLSSNSYAEMEIELMILFYNIVTKKYEEARKIIGKLEGLTSMLTNAELLFFLYCFALYVHKTNQNQKAYQQILVLTSIQYEDTFLESCIYDLAIDIMMIVGQFTIACKYFYYFEKIASMPIFGMQYYIHKIQLLTMDSDVDFEGALEQCTLYTNSLNLKEEEIRENYYYYLGLLYYKNNKYEEAIQCLIPNLISARICSIVGASLIHIYDATLSKNMLEKISQFKLNKYETMYHNFILLIQMVVEGSNNYTLFQYIKNILFVPNQYYEYFLNHELIRMYAVYGIGCSKYKECARVLSKKWEQTIHEKLK